MTSGGAMRKTCSCVSLAATPRASNASETRRTDRAQSLHDLCPGVTRSRDEIFFDEDVERGFRHRASERIPAERAAVFARPEESHQVCVGERCRHGVIAAAECFADHEYV